jgi:hypothetical protein
MRILIASLVMCVAGCSSYDNGPLGYSKRGPIEGAEPDADHNSFSADNRRQGLQLQNAEYSARHNPDARPVPIGVVAARRVPRTPSTRPFRKPQNTRGRGGDSPVQCRQ